MKIDKEFRLCEYYLHKIITEKKLVDGVLWVTMKKDEYHQIHNQHKIFDEQIVSTKIFPLIQFVQHGITPKTMEDIIKNKYGVYFERVENTEYIYIICDVKSFKL